MFGSQGAGSNRPDEAGHVFEPLLAAIAEGALPPGEGGAVAAHVAECDWCAARVATYAEVDALIRAAPAPLPPASLRAGLYASIAAEARQAAELQRPP